MLSNKKQTTMVEIVFMLIDKSWTNSLKEIVTF